MPPVWCNDGWMDRSASERASGQSLASLSTRHRSSVKPSYCCWPDAGSDAELADLKAAYVTHEGDVNKIASELRCCTLDDLERHCGTLRNLVDSRQLSLYKSFTRSAADVRRRSAASRRQQQARYLPKAASNLGVQSRSPILCFLRPGGSISTPSSTSIR